MTYAQGVHDPIVIRADMGQFFRSLRSIHAVGSFPYAWVPEWHPGGHGLHAHFAVGQYIPRRKIESAWGHGFVHIKLLSDLPVGSGRFEESRVAARYLSKYVAKSFDRAPMLGRHRYDVAQGFQPSLELIRGPSHWSVIDASVEVMGSQPSNVWTSGEAENWMLPPAIRLEWA
ncbi:MAG: hypothetical protein Q7V58_06895 [Actinomycetota bacterium]|nr:hypothetical protein [Actinomycetota bacterium]